MAVELSIHKQNLLIKLTAAYVVSSILPILYLGFLFFYVVPVHRSDSSAVIYSLAIPSVILLSISGFLLLFFALRPIRALCRAVDKAVEEIGKTPRSGLSINEVERLTNSFTCVLNELKSKIHDLEDYSTRLAEANKRLADLSITDDSTGLYNDWYFRVRLEEELNQTRRYERKLCLIVIVLDDYLLICEKFGISTWEGVLNELAFLLRQLVPFGNVMARFAENEFAIILSDTSNEEGKALFERLKSEISQHRFSRKDKIGSLIRLDVRFGIAMKEDALCTVDSLIQIAYSSMSTAHQDSRKEVSADSSREECVPK